MQVDYEREKEALVNRALFSGSVIKKSSTYPAMKFINIQE